MATYISVFDNDSYKDYLNAKTGGKSQRKGIKTAMARAARCQPTYISQVLHGKADLSLEQAAMLSQFFEHTQEETNFFILLVLKERAGNSTLRQHFERQLEELRARRMILSQRLGTQEVLTEEQKARYYSSWTYAAIHIALTVPGLRTPPALAAYFRISEKKVAETLHFLAEAGLALKTEAGFTVGKSQVRLGNDSHHIIKHHTNWRTQAIEALEREEMLDLHYSGVASIARADVKKLKDRILEMLKEQLEIVKSSKEEEVYCYTIDFFSLRR